MKIRINDKPIKPKRALIDTENDLTDGCVTQQFLATIPANDNDFIFNHVDKLICVDIDMGDYFYQFDAMLLVAEFDGDWIHLSSCVMGELGCTKNGFDTPLNAVFH